VGLSKQEEREMLQEGDKKILTNVAKVIAVLVVIMFCLIFLASYIGGDAYK
jgi:type IV secretory pathway VirB2 component (pilin)